ncbi:MAG: ATP-binding protein [Calditrichales bacterium]|nr:ATP-binding protein [Calditrichales bacterium]
MFKRWLTLKENKSSLIIGPRRSGKTTLLKNRFPDYKYVTLDNLDYLNWAKTDAKGFIESLSAKAIIDEIQRHPELTVAVKYAIDNHNAHFIMTGSSSIGLLDSTADTLAGRIQLYSLPTACFGENIGAPTHNILSDTAKPPLIREGQRNLREALTYGQFPEILNQSNNEEKQELLSNYRDTYFIRDLMQLSNIENMDGLLAIFHHLARSIGSHLEVSTFARESGLSFPTTKKYLNNLIQSQLTFRLYGYQFAPAKRYIKASKTYFADNGILHSLNIPLNEGQLLENFVIAEFEKRRKLGYLKCDRLYYLKTAAGKEIDLIFETGGEVYAIEIKTTANPAVRDVRNLRDFAQKMEKPVKAFLIYKGEKYKTIDNVQLIPAAALFRGM